MSKIVELKAGEIETVVGGVGVNAMINATTVKPMSTSSFNASIASTSAYNVSAQTFQMSSLNTAQFALRR